MKEVIVSVSASLITLVVLWAVGLIGKIPNQISVPEGAIVAFDRECPEIGWEEYKLAYGRFIRGIDRSGNNIDPEGERIIGTAQEDEFASHEHDFRSYTRSRKIGGGHISINDSLPVSNHVTSAAGGKETRPKNVALLYCKKV